ncbi:hypothetical protein C3L33_15379, partial [Rhododendron williamsianum]
MSIVEEHRLVFQSFLLKFGFDSVFEQGQDLLQDYCELENHLGDCFEGLEDKRSSDCSTPLAFACGSVSGFLFSHGSCIYPG